MPFRLCGVGADFVSTVPPTLGPTCLRTALQLGSRGLGFRVWGLGFRV